MTSARTKPFLTCPTDIFIDEALFISVDGAEYNSPLDLPHWDSSSDIRANVSFSLTSKGLLDSTGLGSDAEIFAHSVWYSAGSSLRGSGSLHPINLTDETPSASLQLDISGSDLARKLDIEYGLVMMSPGSGAVRLAASIPGSCLIWKSHSIMLEGSGARFPVEMFDFDGGGWFPENAAWYLDMDILDLHLPAFGSIQLLLNSGNERVMAAASSNEPEGNDIREVMRFDVARAMICRALDSDEFLDNLTNFPSGSLGEALRRLIARTVGGADSIDGAAQERRADPWRFDCQLQDRFRLFLGSRS